MEDCDNYDEVWDPKMTVKGGSFLPLIIERRGQPSKPNLMLLSLREAIWRRARGSSTGSNFGAVRTPDTLAATTAAAATIKLGGGGGAAATAASIASTKTEDDGHGCCCSLIPF